MLDEHSGSASETPLARLGGMLGVSACIVGFFIFVLGCHGYAFGLKLALIPLGMGALGMVLTVLGAIFRTGGPEDTPILASIFVNLFAMLGGLMMWAAWKEWWGFFPRMSL